MLTSHAILLYREYMITTERSAETLKGYTIELNQFERFISNKHNAPVSLNNVTIQDMEDYLRHLKEKGHAPASRSRVIYILRAFFGFCFKKDYISKNISLKLEAITVPEKERVFLTDAEIEEFIPAINNPLIKIIVKTLFHTGMRISECLNLLLQDVDLKEGIITVRNTKNKKNRQIPIHKELLILLKQYISMERNGGSNPYLFTQNIKAKVSPDFVNKILHETTAALGWKKHITCHTLRHSFASSLVARNINIVNIQKLLGHSDLSTTSVYTHTNIHELKQAINSISRHYKEDYDSLYISKELLQLLDKYSSTLSLSRKQLIEAALVRFFYENMPHGSQARS